MKKSKKNQRAFRYCVYLFRVLADAPAFNIYQFL